MDAYFITINIAPIATNNAPKPVCQVKCSLKNTTENIKTKTTLVRSNAATAVAGPCLSA